MRVIAFAILLAGCSAAQPIGFGVKLGAPVTDAVNLANGSGTLANTATRFTIGPMVDIRLPFGVGIEADFLYRRLSGTYTEPGFSTAANGNQWAIPVLLKYRFPFPIVRPYLEAGPSFRWVTNVDHQDSCLESFCGGSSANVPQSLTTDNGAGLTIGGGVEAKLLFIRIAPELRYTRWGSPAFTLHGVTSTILQANQNQAEFLVGISF
jgi:opacity protein-like surface antigen